MELMITKTFAVITVMELGLCMIPAPPLPKPQLMTCNDDNSREEVSMCDDGDIVGYSAVDETGEAKKLITVMFLAMWTAMMLAIMMMGVEGGDVDKEYDDDSGANDVNTLMKMMSTSLYRTTMMVTSL